MTRKSGGKKRERKKWAITNSLNILVHNIKVSSQLLGKKKKPGASFYSAQPFCFMSKTSDSCSAVYIPCISLNINFRKRIGKT